MRIMMVTNNYTPYSGGVVSSINVSVDQLQRMGHNVIIVSFDFTAQHDEDPHWVQRIWSPIRFMYKSNHMAIAWRPYAQIQRLFARFKPDIVHVHHPFLLGSVAAALARKQRIPVVFTYHTLYEEYAYYIPLPESFVRWATAYLVRIFCKRVHGIVAPSTAIADLLRERATCCVEVIATGLQRDFIPDACIPVHHHERLHLLVVGRLVKEKNICDVLDVAARLVQRGIKFQLTIIGYGEEYVPLTTYAYETLKLPTECVIFVYKPAREVIMQAYKDADLFLFTSRTDTQGLVLAEAMAAATAVIAFDGAGQRDIIKQAYNGFIVNDTQAMVATIEHLDAQRDQLAALKRGAQITAYAYHPERTVQRLFDFYQRVIRKQQAAI
jgi:glycosyltransferase involved in cell wall biosynthesis